MLLVGGQQGILAWPARVDCPPSSGLLPAVKSFGTEGAEGVLSFSNPVLH